MTKKIASRPSSPQRPPPKQKKLSSGIVPIYRPDAASDFKEDLYLLLRCYNYWDFPKGGVDLGETPLQAALRELQEETAITKANLVWGEGFRETAVYAGGKVARYYVGLVDTLDVVLLDNPLLGRPEHHEFRWVTYKNARSLLGDRVREILDWAHELSRGG
jgi:bis(5'-nucleosidyl)-tetraphosphatase